MVVVDAFSMVGGVTYRQDPMGFPQLYEAMSRTGVELAAVMSLRSLTADARKGNDYLFAEAGRDRRIIPIGVVAPHSTSLEAPALIASCVENGAAALAFNFNRRDVSLSSLALRRTLDEAAKTGLPIVACGPMQPGVPSQLAELTRDLGSRLLLVGSYYGMFDELLAVLDEHPHVHAECGWQITPGAVELTVEHAGPDRVLFGSGAPMRPVQPSLNLVLDSDIDDITKRKVLATNALRLFGRHREAERIESEPVRLPEVRIPSTPAIDVHNHLGVAASIPLTIRDVDAIEQSAERFGMEYSVCSATVAYQEDIEAGNREMLAKIDGRPRLLGSPVVNPTHLEASIRWLDACCQNDRLVHATLDPGGVGVPMGSEPYITLFEEAWKRRVPVFWNYHGQDYLRSLRWQKDIGYLPRIRSGAADEIGLFLEVNRRFPDLPVIIGHGLGEDGISLARRTKNIYLEFSGSYPEPGALRKAIDAVGKDRVVFGSDMDLIAASFALGVYYEADMTPEEERLVMADNARRILRLPEQHRCSEK